jgi:hypothetical protein
MAGDRLLPHFRDTTLIPSMIPSLMMVIMMTIVTMVIMSSRDRSRNFLDINTPTLHI